MNKLQAKNISMSFVNAQHTVDVLTDISLVLDEGQSIAIIGSSGCGKTTLLQILAGLETPSVGKVFFNDINLSANNKTQFTQLRSSLFGFVYQFHYLLEDLTIFENCELTFQILQLKDRAANHQSILAIFEELGISHLKDHYPFMLSGGERQRAAIARAVAHKPTFLLMDEPTGNLDNENAAIIQELTINLSKKLNMGIIVATHDLDYAKQLDDVYKIENTKLHRIDNE
ncbi:ABC transporter ATP-binding protein [Gammaproteobacteria bacterium]|nr:ABC transporter ATP-binding protein [Gammaproteobacteria bacterium]MDB9837924.1 ABC transporter ATP-binding protein [Gammaproteobacteria bacterium]MDB9855003.1 ABC transporter ATP-binding protein [Gammaproteobacteria bacterium]